MTQLNRFDLNLLLEFAREQRLSLEVDYCQPLDTLCIQVRSNFIQDRLEMKGVPSVESFIQNWLEHVKTSRSADQP